LLPLAPLVIAGSRYHERYTCTEWLVRTVHEV
jgi:hypothetical protein